MRDTAACSHIHGEPVLKDCYNLAAFFYYGWPGEPPDNKHHLFKLEEKFVKAGQSVYRPSLEASANPVDPIKVAQRGKWMP